MKCLYLKNPPTPEAVKKIGDTTSFSCVVFEFNLEGTKRAAAIPPASKTV